MKIWAIVRNGAVAELPQFADNLDATKYYPSDWIVIDVTAVTGIAVGWLYNGTTFSAPAVVPPTQADLIAYANRRQWSIATGGYTMTVAGQALTFATDQVSQALITGLAVRLSQPNPPTSVNWQFAAGFVTLQAADFMSAATQIADAIQSTFDTLKTVVSGISATPPTITTTAQIDAAFHALAA